MLKKKTEKIINILKQGEAIFFEIDVLMYYINQMKDKDNSFDEKMKIQEFNKELIKSLIGNINDNHVKMCLRILELALKEREEDLEILFDNYNINYDGEN